MGVSITNKKFRCTENYDFGDGIIIPKGEIVFVKRCDSNDGVIFKYHNDFFNCVYNNFIQSFELIEDKVEKYSDSQEKISGVLESMKSLLIYKNQKYGDSALHPNNVFYKGDSTNSILIRLDDKLGRIKNNDGELRVNDVCDLIGYLTLLLVSMGVDVSEIDKLKD